MKKTEFSQESTFCSLPWTGFSNDPSGQVRPCCIYQENVTDEQGKPFYIQETSLADILNSKYMKDLRNEFRQGKKPAGCSSCWKDEEFGKKSKREIYLKDVDFSEEPKWPKELQVIISNTCNLKCRTCAPTHSTLWFQEALDRNRMWMPPSPGPIISDSSVFWNERKQWLESVEIIEIVGGEPFLIKGWMDIWTELVKMGRSKSITIQMSTNATIFKPDVVKFLIENFKWVGIGLSIDGVESKFEYLRHPGKWKTTKENLQGYYDILKSNYPNFGTQITHTISWMNLFYVPSFHEYISKNWPDLKIWNNVVYHPEHLSASALPDRAKELIEAEFLKSSLQKNANQDVHRDLMGILEFIKSKPFSPDVFKRGVTEIMAGDEYRHETYEKTFPEFFKAITHFWQKT